MSKATMTRTKLRNNFLQNMKEKNRTLNMKTYMKTCEKLNEYEIPFHLHFRRQ